MDRIDKIYMTIKQQIECYEIHHNSIPNALYLDIKTIELMKRNSHREDIVIESFGTDTYPVMTYYGMTIIPVLSSFEHINVAYKE